MICSMLNRDALIVRLLLGDGTLPKSGGVFRGSGQGNRAAPTGLTASHKPWRLSYL
jgi:hypothetical protein